MYFQFPLVFLFNQTKSSFLHIEKDIINIRCWYCSKSIVICVTCAYDIVLHILKPYLRFSIPWVGLQYVIMEFPDYIHLLLLFDSSKCMKIIAFRWKIIADPIYY